MIRPLDRRCIVPLVVVLLGAVGCMDRDLTGMDPAVQSITVLSFNQNPEGKVDILVVVDNSGSMSQEQRALATHFPLLIHELMNPSDPTQDPVTDLHVGVVSTDLGSSGYEVPTCGNGTLGWAGGDDGCLLHDPSPGVTGCSASYPLFLERVADDAGYSLDRMAADFGCIATLGTSGCGFEQQMGAARRALVEQSGEGRCNAGFLRQDSILAVLWVSDEEDCSVSGPYIHGTDEMHPNIRCYFLQEHLRSPVEMIHELRGLRSDVRNFVAAMIVGVPVDLRCEGRGDALGSCLALDEMQYRPDPSDPTNVLPACIHPDGWGMAYPGRRFVEAALQVGENALVRSICNDDWRPAMVAILDLIEGANRKVCFPHELALDPDTCQAECDVVEILSDARPCPAGRAEANPPTEVDAVSGVERRRCVIPQAARTPGAGGACGADPTTAGWFYLPKDQSADECDQVEFTDDAVPDAGSETQLECLSYVCPPERRCGSASNPGGRCCGVGEACADEDPLLGGRCVPSP